jgi:hypothetical protein
MVAVVRIVTKRLAYAGPSLLSAAIALEPGHVYGVGPTQGAAEAAAFDRAELYPGYIYPRYGRKGQIL